MFRLDQNDSRYRLPSTVSEQMLRHPSSHRFPRFALARVFMIDVVVELIDRYPIRVLRTTFSILTFDGEGYLESSALGRHQRDRAELALAPPVAEPEPTATAPVVDSTENSNASY